MYMITYFLFLGFLLFDVSNDHIDPGIHLDWTTLTVC